MEIELEHDSYYEVSYPEANEHMIVWYSSEALDGQGGFYACGYERAFPVEGFIIHSKIEL